MYTLALRRDFIAHHFLIGGDWGLENLPNSHHYVLELQLEGDELDQNGYLCDLLNVERLLDSAVTYYREKMLNDLPEFKGLNPSLEHFSRILCSTLSEHIREKNISALKVILWENNIAWASYKIQR